MKTHSLIALAGSVIIVAASIAVFAHSTRPPAYDISLAPSVIDGVQVQNLPAVNVTGYIKASNTSPALTDQLDGATLDCPNPHALASLRLVMPYYSFAHGLTSFNKD